MRRTLKIFTIFVIISFLLLLVHPVPALAGSTSNLVSNQNTVLTLSGNTGPIPSTNSTSIFTIPLGSILSSSGQMFDASDITLVIYNDATAGQAITQESIEFTGSIDGQAVLPVSYPPYANNSVSINSGATGSVLVPVNGAILPNLNAVITVTGTTPTGGEIYVTAYVKAVTSNLVTLINGGNPITSTNPIPIVAEGNNSDATIGYVNQAQPPWYTYSDGGTIGLTGSVPYTTAVTGNGVNLSTLNGTFSQLVPGGTGTAQIRIQGTWVGTISFYYNLYGTPSYYTIPAEAYPAGGGSSVTSTTTDGTWNIPLTGLSNQDSVVMEMTSYTSGTADIVFSPGGPPGIVTAVQPTASNLNETPNLNNSPVSSSNPLPVQQASSAQAPANPNQFYYSFNSTSSIGGINACFVPTSGHTLYVTHAVMQDIETAGTTSALQGEIITGVSGGTIAYSQSMTAVNTTLNTLTPPVVNVYSAAPTFTAANGFIFLFNSAPATITSDVQRSISLSGTAELPISAAVSGQGQEICVYDNTGGADIALMIEGYEQ